MSTFEDILLDRVKMAVEANASVREDPTEEIEDVGHKTEAVPEEQGVVPTTSPVTLTNVMRHPEAHALALNLLLSRKYGLAWFDWEPETLELHLKQDFGGVSDINMTKIQACKTLQSVDTYWQRWEVFSWCSTSLNGVFPDFEVLQAPTAIEMLIAVDTANRIRDDVPWSTEVEAFIAESLRHDGLLVPIKPLDFVKIDVSDFGIDVARVRLLWARAAITKQAPAEETAEAEQVRRMLYAQSQLDLHLNQLRSQLPLVNHVPAFFARP